MTICIVYNAQLTREYRKYCYLYCLVTHSLSDDLDPLSDDLDRPLLFRVTMFTSVDN